MATSSTTNGETKDDCAMSSPSSPSSLLSMVIVGASGDLAMKMTYPSLFELYKKEKLPKSTLIYGFARSEMTDDELRDKVRKGLKNEDDDDAVDEFLGLLKYHSGEGYDHVGSYQDLDKKLREFEDDNSCNADRLFYLAIPPSSFSDVASAVREACIRDDDRAGFHRIVMEKPFGKDLDSFNELQEGLSKHFNEEQTFRIDHYLGDEMVQNLLVLRFGNSMFDCIWEKSDVQCITIKVKEDFGVEGRGGYFDEYGIVRDMLQNHLLMVTTLLTMDAPEGNLETDDEAIRDAKLKLLKSIKPIKKEDIMLGQYEGYHDDDTIENKDSKTPTYAAVKIDIDNERWSGVPIILVSGKALDESRGEVRVQFRDAPNSKIFYSGNTTGTDCPRNEIVIGMSPSPHSVCLKTNVKRPGMNRTTPIQTNLMIGDYCVDEIVESIPDPYTRLILNVLEGDHAAFMREDELRRAWEIFTPLLQDIEDVDPIIYKRGSTGPDEAEKFIYKHTGYVHHEGAVLEDGQVKE